MDVVVVGFRGIADEGPVMFCRVKKEEKYVTEMEVLRQREPDMPKK